MSGLSSKRARPLIRCAVALALCATSVKASELQQRMTFDIPAQSIEGALLQLSQQSALQILFSADSLPDGDAPRVVGRMPIEDALKLLLRGTQLGYKLVGERTLTVGTNDMTRAAAGSNLRGVAWQDSQERWPAAGSAGPSLRLAQAETAGAAKSDSPMLEEIVVVGSSLRIAKEDVEGGSLPIQLITQQELSASGSRTIGEYLRTEPAFSGAAGGLGNGSARTTLNLRGLGSQYTLTLVNGRRTGVNGPANVARIPMEAVERIEVLKAGASAVYGSDAVAGVVNIVLKTSEEGAGVTARYGSSDGGYDEQEVTAHLGAKNEDGSFIALVNHRETSGLAALERAVTASNDQRRFGGRDDRSSFNLPAPIVLPGGQVMIINTDRVPVGSTSLSLDDFRPYSFERDAHDRPLFGNYVLSPSRNTSFVFSGETSLTDRTRISADVLLDRTVVNGIGGAGTFNATVPASNPYNPFGVDVVARYRGLDLGVGYKFETRLDSISGGARLEHALTDDLSLSIGASLSSESAQDTGYNVYSRRGVIEALNRPGADALNPFGNRANSPEQLRGALVRTDSMYDEKLYEFDVRVTGSFFSLPAGDVQTAFGASSRNENVHDIPDSLFVVGDVFDTSTIAEFELERDVVAAFGEVRIPLLEGNGGAAPLELGLAARYEEYSDFGDTFDPLVSLKWAATPSISLRTSFNTSFRAPFLDNLIPNENQSDITVTDPLTGLRTEVVAISGGNPNLKPENAKTFSIGTVFTPQAVPGLFASLDYYKINQTDVIISPSPQAVINGEIPGEVIRQENIGRGGEDILIIAQLTNVAKRDLSGLDFLSRYTLDLDNGSTLSFNLAAHYLLTFEADVLDGRGMVSAADRYSFLFSSLPALRANGGISWEKGAFTANANINFVSNYEDPPIEGRIRNSATVDSVTMLNLGLQVDLGRTLPWLRQSSLRLGVENVTDELPPFILALNGYDRGQHDIRGRFTYLSMNMGF